MKILNWNTRWISPRGRGWRFDAAKALIEAHDPDIICLTEAYPELMPSGGTDDNQRAIRRWQCRKPRRAQGGPLESIRLEEN